MTHARAASTHALFRRRKLDPRHPHFKGRAWELLDDEGLAFAIAQLALGQWKHVEKLRHLDPNATMPNPTYAIDQAIASLTVKAGGQAWHRDGWVFQFISWIVAVESGKNHTIRAPQMDQASKGFDGLQLLLSHDGSEVVGIIVFEDKATDSPRDTVRDDVWPSFRQLEAGERDAALAAEIAALLDRLPQFDAIETVDRLMRNPEARMFRVSITTDSYHAQAPHFNGLFDGYEDAVSGSRGRRYANVLELQNLRGWMSDLCDRAVELLEAMRDV